MIENAGRYHCVALCDIMKNRKMWGLGNLKSAPKGRNIRTVGILRDNLQMGAKAGKYERCSRIGVKIIQLVLQQNTPAAIPGIAVTQDCFNNHKRHPARPPLDKSTEMNLFDTLSPSSDSIPAEISVETTEFLNRRDIARFAISDVRNNLIELGAGVYGTV